MGVLRKHPRVEQHSPVVVEYYVAVLQHPVADRVLHPGIGRDDEVAGGPGPEKDHQGRKPVDPLAEPVLPPEEQSYERRLEEEGERSLHCQCLGDYVPGEGGEGRPVGPELELERDAGDDPHNEGYREDLAPESRRHIVELVAVAHVDALQNEDE
jgi:hypothetical protein